MKKDYSEYKHTDYEKYNIARQSNSYVYYDYTILLFHCQFFVTLKSEVMKMNENFYKSYDELPLMLSVQEIAKVLGISKTSAYELVRSKGFPVLKIGSRMVVPKEKFREWVEQNTGGSI